MESISFGPLSFLHSSAGLSSPCISNILENSSASFLNVSSGPQEDADGWWACILCDITPSTFCGLSFHIPFLRPKGYHNAAFPGPRWALLVFRRCSQFPMRSHMDWWLSNFCPQIQYILEWWFGVLVMWNGYSQLMGIAFHVWVP